MRKIIYVALILGFLVGAFFAIYLRQPTGFAVMAATALAFAYTVMRGK